MATVLGCAEQFLSQNARIDGYKSSEFKRLGGVCYLDYAGASLYSERQIEQHFADLQKNLYGNPHSNNESSSLTTDLLEQARYRVLAWLGTTAEEYSVIFTSGCTASLKLVAECFDFGSSGDAGNNDQLSRGKFLYLEDNHTSAVGMREIIHDRGVKSTCWTAAHAYNVFNQSSESENFISVEQTASHDSFQGELNEHLCTVVDNAACNGLFVYPAQSNFNGHRYPLEWIMKAQAQLSGSQSHCYVLLDAASFLMTSELSLTDVKPDFVTLSFYKIFGFPTGLGALIVRNSSAGVLKKRYFGGGTVQVSLTSSTFHVHKASISDRFEDGTVAFLDILALKHGFDSWERITGGVRNVSQHCFTLTKYVYHHLAAYQHGNGAPVAKIHSDTNYDTMATQGPIITFSLLHADGTYIGFSQVDKLASSYNIHLRVGCFCNMGACQHHLQLTDQQVKDNFKAGHVCGDNIDLVDGQPTGAIRVSFGYMSTLADAQFFLRFIMETFIEGPATSDNAVDIENDIIFQQLFSTGDAQSLNDPESTCNERAVLSNTNNQIQHVHQIMSGSGENCKLDIHLKSEAFGDQNSFSFKVSTDKAHENEQGLNHLSPHIKVSEKTGNKICHGKTDVEHPVDELKSVELLDSDCQMKINGMIDVQVSDNMTEMTHPLSSNELAERDWNSIPEEKSVNMDDTDELYHPSETFTTEDEDMLAGVASCDVGALTCTSLQDCPQANNTPTHLQVHLEICQHNSPSDLHALTQASEPDGVEALSTVQSPDSCVQGDDMLAGSCGGGIILNRKQAAEALTELDGVHPKASELSEERISQKCEKFDSENVCDNVYIEEQVQKCSQNTGSRIEGEIQNSSVTFSTPNEKESTVWEVYRSITSLSRKLMSSFPNYTSTTSSVLSKDDISSNSSTSRQIHSQLLESTGTATSQSGSTIQGSQEEIAMNWILSQESLSPNEPYSGQMPHSKGHSANKLSAAEVGEITGMADDTSCHGNAEQIVLSQICVYPVKSCAAFKVSSWELGPGGLLYDRQWMIITEAGICLSQKREPRLALIRPSINLNRGTLQLSFDGLDDIEVPLILQSDNSILRELCQSKVCGDRVSVSDCGTEVANWLMMALDRPGLRLVQQQPGSSRWSKYKKTVDEPESQLSLANEAQYLLLHQNSIAALYREMQEGSVGHIDVEELCDRFRGNFVVAGGTIEPFGEEEWGQVRIGQSMFLTRGPCVRCQMICVDQQTGERGKEPLRSLAKYRGSKLRFGLLLQHVIESRENDRIAVGDDVMVMSV